MINSLIIFDTEIDFIEYLLTTCRGNVILFIVTMLYVYGDDMP